MSSNIPPLMSSSPPPLCDSDDEEDDDDNEFGMFTTAEELDYNDCIPFQTTNDRKINISERSTHTIKNKSTEQDTTSQDSTTDSGLCPDSEGMSPTPHSDDERTEVVKIRVCKRLQENLILNNHETEDKKCVINENGMYDNLDTITNRPNLDSIASNNLETQASQCCNSESEILNNTDSSDDFGNFEFAPVRDECVSNSNHVQNNDSSESVKCESQETEVLNSSRASSANSITINDEYNDRIVKTVLPIEDDSEQDSLKNNLSQVMIDNKNEVTGLILDPVDHSIVEEQTGCDSLEGDITEFLDGAQQLKLSEDSDVDTFGDFQFESVNQGNEMNKIDLEQHIQAEHGEPNFESEEVEFDDFADFSHSNFNEFDELAASMEKSNNIHADETRVQLSPTKEEVNLKLEPVQFSNNDNWSELFPVEESRSNHSECIPITVQDSLIWRKLYPIEASPALLYQWSNSCANKKLLSALNIDSRNILFMPWCNMSVPRFAANLGFGPLEPVRASEPLQPAFPPPLPTSASPSEETVPDAHFDWGSSGLTNPLDCLESNTEPYKSLSSEAEKIVQMLPNLAYMKKTYLEFTTTKHQ